ncbi:MAG: LysM peptidoglycan-binding domain-containing protein [Caldilineaceae bacterium]
MSHHQLHDHKYITAPLFPLGQLRDKQRSIGKALLCCTVVALLFLTAFATSLRAQGSCGGSVTVAAGDTLYRIAARCNTTVRAILAANPQIRNPNIIYRGQVLTLPTGNDSAGNGNPNETTVSIAPTAGPPGTLITVTARNFPANMAVTVGIGEPESEPVASISATTDAAGTLNIQVAVPENAQPNQRFVVLVFVPGQGNVRATSQGFITTSGESGSTVSIAPSQGEAGTTVQLEATGFAPNIPVEIGFGRVNSEYDVIAQTITNENGALSRRVSVPPFAQPDDRYVFTVLPQGTTQETISSVFTVTGDDQPFNPKVTISPRAGPPGANIQVAVSGFPANRRVNYGIGKPEGQLLHVFSARTNRNGSAQMTLQVPKVDVGTTLEVTVFVPQQVQTSVMSGAFTVTQDSEGNENLFTHTNIYLVALEDDGRSGMEIGCGDSIVPVEVEIEPTIAPLTAALEKLFSINQRFYGESGLYNALYQSNLAIERIDIENGVASIYLTGNLQIGGVCDEPRLRAQLEETALQYYTIDEVRIFVNGEPLPF